MSMLIQDIDESDLMELYYNNEYISLAFGEVIWNS